jgi:uncharacterized protein YutE (UPF0331/DUF86 family)
MSPGILNRRILSDRIAWIDRMLEEIGKLPLENYDRFLQDTRNIWAAESCLRRALEALLDLGRHILAKGFGKGITEYKEIARQLRQESVLDRRHAELLEVLAGYRNRMTHFYHEIGTEELYDICRKDIRDIRKVKEVLVSWINANPDRVTGAL